MNDYNDAFISFINVELLFLLLAVVRVLGVYAAGYCLP